MGSTGLKSRCRHGHAPLEVLGMNPSVCLSQLPAAICLLSFQPRPPSSKCIIPALPPWFVLPSSVSLPLLPLIRAACITSAKSLLPSNRPQKAGPGGLCRPSSAYHVLLRSFQCPQCLPCHSQFGICAFSFFPWPFAPELFPSILSCTRGGTASPGLLQQHVQREIQRSCHPWTGHLSLILGKCTKT